MIDILLNVCDVEDRLTNEEIADEVITILFAVGMIFKFMMIGGCQKLVIFSFFSLIFSKFREAKRTP